VAQSDPEHLGAVRLLPYLGWACLEAGDADRAEEVVLEGIERSRAQGHGLALVELLRVHGMVLAEQHRREEAERAFELAVSVARSMRYPYAEARALYEQGLMYAGAPDASIGKDRLERAAEIFRSLGSRPYCDLAQRALAHS
jgi:tetratricopeptide (TPR) repeat protein